MVLPFRQRPANRGKMGAGDIKEPFAMELPGIKMA